MRDAEIGIKIKVDDAVKELKKLGKITDEEVKSLSKVWQKSLTDQLAKGKTVTKESTRFSAEALSTYKQATAAVLGDQINDVLDITASLGFLGPEVLAVGVAVGAVVGSMAALGLSMKAAFEAGQTLTDWAIATNEGMKGLGDGVELSKSQLSGLQEVSDSFAAAGVAFDKQFLQVLGESIPELKRVADALVPISIELSGALAEGLQMSLPLLAGMSEALAALYQVGSGLIEVFAAEAVSIWYLTVRFGEIHLMMMDLLNPMKWIAEGLRVIGRVAIDAAYEFINLFSETSLLKDAFVAISSPINDVVGWMGELLDVFRDAILSFSELFGLSEDVAGAFADISEPIAEVSDRLWSVADAAYDSGSQFFDLSGKTGMLGRASEELLDIYKKLVVIIKSYVQPAIEKLNPIFKAAEEGVAGMAKKVQSALKAAFRETLGGDAVDSMRAAVDEIDEAFAAIAGAWTGETAATDQNYQATKRLVGAKRDLTKANKEVKDSMDYSQDLAFELEWQEKFADQEYRTRKEQEDAYKKRKDQEQKDRDKDKADAETLAKQELSAKQSMIGSAQALADISATYSQNRLSALQQELEAQEEAGTAGVGYIKQMIAQEKQRATRRAAFAKAIALTEAITQTYVAVTEALPNPILAAAAGAAGAAAVASIAAAPLPQYHSGGVVTANLLQGEAVLNRSAVAAMGEQSVNRMNDRTNRQQSNVSNIYLKGRLVDQIVEEGVRNGPKTRRALSVVRTLAQYT